MKSKIFKLFLLLLILYPLPIFARDARTNVVTYRYSGTTCTGSECFGSKAIGLEISILRYNGSGNPSTVGRMLIANEALFGSKTYFVSSGVTAGTTDEIAQRYDFNEGGMDVKEVREVVQDLVKQTMFLTILEIQLVENMVI